ncbi:MAG: hypothetical protein IT480_03750 [Gammaproteobacteria bacterium]|nr:hypothetical protein [Gammaproteobacteria bacterium]
MPRATGISTLRLLQRTGLQQPTSPARARLRAAALELVQAEGLDNAGAWAYEFVELGGLADALLCDEGRGPRVPWADPPSGRLTGVACCVCTVGPRLPARVQDLFAARERALAVGLDELGNELLFALSRRVEDRILVDARRRGLSMSGELRAGDPGLALTAQPLVLRLAGAADIGVTLAPTLLMNPEKSTSAVLGVGLDLPPTDWSRCDACRSRERCQHRVRELAEAQKA